MAKKLYEVTPDILALTEICQKNTQIDSSLYTKYQVNRGLRDVNGRGVLTGLTEVSEIRSSITGPAGESLPCERKFRISSCSASSRPKIRSRPSVICWRITVPLCPPTSCVISS